MLAIHAAAEPSGIAEVATVLDVLTAEEASRGSSSRRGLVIMEEVRVGHACSVRLTRARPDMNVGASAHHFLPRRGLASASIGYSQICSKAC